MQTFRPQNTPETSHLSAPPSRLAAAEARPCGPCALRLRVYELVKI
jgi:hypothetical protein